MDKRIALVQLTTTPGAATAQSSTTGYPPTFGGSPLGLASQFVGQRISDHDDLNNIPFGEV
jgi:hypothetical protein